jgi:hypothetical protein
MWIMYVPEQGHWDVPYTGNNKQQARKAAAEMWRKAFGSRLPNGTKVVRDPE